MILEQGKVECILADRLTMQGVTLERGVELIDVQQEPDQVVAMLRSSDGQESSAIARYVVGCDGAHSVVRRLIGATFAGNSRPGQYALADVQIDWRDQPYDDNLHVFFSPMLVMGRLAEGSWKVAGLMPASVDTTNQSEEEFVLATLQQQMDWNSIPAKLHSPRWTSLFRISTRMVERMRDRRVFLAGDAAHIHSPMGGQGMNEGMQDALNLAWKLALVLRGQAEEDLLDTYQAERHPVIANVLRDTHQMTQLSEIQNPLVGYLRDAAIASTTSLKPVQAALRLQFSGSQRSLGESRLIHDSQPLARGPQVGQRAPDGEGIVSFQEGTERRLFQLWAEEAQPFFHRLLIFVGQQADAKRVAEIGQLAQHLTEQWDNILRAYVVCPADRSIKEVGMKSVPLLQDRSGELQRRYGAHSECLYLIRPDGFVGFRSRRVELQPLHEFLMRMKGT